jgi:3-methyladenine DNA glycosylase/8-oxoguanine DNA glycosylase
MSSENRERAQVGYDPVAIAAALDHLRAADPILSRVIDAVGPFALQPDPNSFYALLSSIVSQQISVRAAATIMGRIEALFPADEGVTPEGVLALGPEPLRTAGLSGMKTRYVLDLAGRIVAGELDLERLAELDDEAVISHLVQVKGIGRWTAQMHLIFRLCRLDVLPVDDLGFRAAVRRHYDLPDLPTRDESHALGAPWAPYRTVATWYLWRSLGTVPRGDDR